jgi:hypothetical protein
MHLSSVNLGLQPSGHPISPLSASVGDSSLKVRGNSDDDRSNNHRITAQQFLRFTENSEPTLVLGSEFFEHIESNTPLQDLNSFFKSAYEICINSPEHVSIFHFNFIKFFLCSYIAHLEINSNYLFRAP